MASACEGPSWSSRVCQDIHLVNFYSKAVHTPQFTPPDRDHRLLTAVPELDGRQTGGDLLPSGVGLVVGLRRDLHVSDGRTCFSTSMNEIIMSSGGLCESRTAHPLLPA